MAEFIPIIEQGARNGKPLIQVYRDLVNANIKMPWVEVLKEYNRVKNNLTSKK